MLLAHKRTILGIVKSPGLARLIHVALATHLLIVGSLLALVIGGVTYYWRSNEIAENVLAVVSEETEILRVRTQQLAKERGLALPEAAQAVILEMQPAFLANRTGTFITIEICRQDGLAILLWKATGHSFSAKDRCLSPGKEANARSGKFSHQVLRHQGQVYVLTRSSVSAASGRSEPEVLTTFLLSDSARHKLERTAIDAALLSILIVCLATAAIYPAVLLLVRRVGKLTEHLLHSNLEMMLVLGAAIAQRDGDTDEHNYRVTLYSIGLAEALNLGRAEMRCLVKGAFLHDVGKIGIPDRILRKPGPLSDDEMQTMRSHVALGLEIIFRSDWLAEAAVVVGCHHERVDGRGYPGAISGEEIPLLARIFAIADVFDALCSRRPYKEALPVETAISIMRREAGGHFDQCLFNSFEGIAGELHARYANRPADGLRVELNSILVHVFSDRISRLAG